MGQIIQLGGNFKIHFNKSIINQMFPFSLSWMRLGSFKPIQKPSKTKVVKKKYIKMICFLSTVFTATIAAATGTFKPIWNHHLNQGPGI